jgi:hypothetical protein
MEGDQKVEEALSHGTRQKWTLHGVHQLPFVNVSTKLVCSVLISVGGQLAIEIQSETVEGEQLGLFDQLEDVHGLVPLRNVDHQNADGSVGKDGPAYNLIFDAIGSLL